MHDRRLVEFTDLVNQIANRHCLHPAYVSDRLGKLGAEMDEHLYHIRTGRFSAEGSVYARTIIQGEVLLGTALDENAAYCARDDETSRMHLCNLADYPVIRHDDGLPEARQRAAEDDYLNGYDECDA